MSSSHRTKGDSALKTGGDGSILKLMVFALAVVLSVLTFFPVSTEAKVFMTVTEALAKTFPTEKGCKIQTESKYLTPKQMKDAADLSGYETRSALVVRYSATCGGKPAGYAYTDSHRVRTHPETLFIEADVEGRLGKVEVLSFDEPLDYIPRAVWYESFKGAVLNAELQIKRKIPFVTGASLTAQATAQAIRRVLAIDQVLRSDKEHR